MATNVSFFFLFIKVDDNKVEKEKEEQDLLASAIDAARLRVVVKRPIKAPQLGDGSAKPSYAIAGSVNRWDVYVQPPLPVVVSSS